MCKLRLVIHCQLFNNVEKVQVHFVYVKPFISDERESPCCCFVHLIYSLFHYLCVFVQNRGDKRQNEDNIS